MSDSGSSDDARQPCHRHGAGRHPDLQRGREHRADRRPGARQRPRRSTSWSSTTARRTAPARSPTRSPRTTTRCRCCTAPRSRASGAAYLAGFAWGLERGVRRPGRDGRRRLAPARAAAPAPRRAARRRPRARLALGPRRAGRQLATPPRAAVARRQHLRPARCSGIPLRDATGGFRAFRRATLEKLDLADVASQGYCFQVDLARRAVAAGLVVVEVPITFVEREHGESKMDGDDRPRGAGAGDRVGRSASARARLRRLVGGRESRV